MKKNILLKFFLYSSTTILFLAACLTKHSQPAETSDGVRGPASVYPRYLDIPVPSGGIEVQTNPPVLRWAIEKEAGILYEVRLSQDSLFRDSLNTLTTKTAMALFNPHRRLQNGKWFWQYKRAGGEFSAKLAFRVTDQAVPVISPSPSEFLKAIPASHPRVLLQKEEVSKVKGLKDNPDALAIISEAENGLLLPVPSEKDAFSKGKTDEPAQQRKFNLDSSQEVSSGVYETILSLAQAWMLTGEEKFAEKAILLGMEVSSWDPEGITKLSDFGDARCMLATALVFDTFYDRLDQSQKQKLLQSTAARAANFYTSWINDIEAKVLSGHVWQHILHYFFQASLALHGEVPGADQWLIYAYELFLGRAPVLGGFDGGWVEGVSYFRMNMETMIDIPLFIKKLTGFDLINSHPWYAGNVKWMIYHIPPGSSADGFGDNTEEVYSPGTAYIVYAEEIAKLTGNPLAAWYAEECKKYETPDFSATPLMRWIRLTKTRELALPSVTTKPDLPTGVVFRDIGLAALHSNIKNTPENLMVAFKSSPLGSYGHMLCDQNTFNILYGGQRLFFRTGYKVTMDDPHRTGWYRTTKSQNGILINGEGQTYSNDAFGWISRFMQGDEIAYLKGDASNAWKNEETNEPEVKKVVRHLILLKPDVIVIYDELESGKEVSWSWLIHSMEKMEVDPGNGTFTVILPTVKGAGKIFSSQEMQWALADTFDVPAVNWRKSRYADGRLKTYDDPQWHLKVSSFGKSSVMRCLAVLQISPDTNPDSLLSGSKPDEHGKVDITVGQWSVSASMNTNFPPDLLIQKTDKKAAFSIHSKEINLNGEKFNGSQANSSFLIEMKNDKAIIQEVTDSIPQMMKNVMLYHQILQK